jgi:hypothetical protein
MNALQPTGIRHLASLSETLATAATPRLLTGAGLLFWAVPLWSYAAILCAYGGVRMLTFWYLWVHVGLALVLSVVGAQLIRIGWAFWQGRYEVGSRREAGLWALGAVATAVSMLLAVF